MIIKYCPECIGFPYTKSMTMEVCPICGADLETEMVSKESILKKRKQLIESSYTDMSTRSDNEYDDREENNHYEDDNNESFESADDDFIPPKVFMQNEVSREYSSPDKINMTKDCVSGRVINYKCSSEEGGHYSRFYIQKIFDFLLYGQKTDDVLHRFCVHVGQEDSYGYTQTRDVPVNVHGTISNGLSINDNSEVEVKGKYNSNRVFMAKEVYITNYGSKTKVNFKHDPRVITDFVFMMIAIILMIITAVNYNGSFVDGIGSFIKTWIVMLIIFGILYLFLFAKLLFLSVIMGKNKFSISGVVFLSFIATLVYMNKHIIWAATGSAIMSFLQSIIITIIVGAIIIYLIKALIGF